MHFSDQQIKDFGVALNEATLVGLEVEAERRLAAITLAVLSVPADAGPPPQDRRVQLVLAPLGRVAASLRLGAWDDVAAPVEVVPLNELFDAVTSFNGLPIYGWEFLDVPEDPYFAKWAGRLSLDWRSEPNGVAHTLDLFQAHGTARHLDVRLWFDELRIFDPQRREIPFDDFVAAGVRWWDGLYAGDPRTEGFGVYPGDAPVDVKRQLLGRWRRTPRGPGSEGKA